MEARIVRARGAGLLFAADLRPPAVMSEPDAGTCRAAIGILLHGLAAEQRQHATVFLLDELERLYASGGHSAPTWISVLRTDTTR
jgi:hypothetical protein